MSLVELKDVVKRYGQHTVLDGVSLTVEKGEIIAIIGRSGSGKSTMLRCINGLEPIQGGTVAFDGTVVNDPATDLRKLSVSSSRASTSFRTSRSSATSRLRPPW
jgi:polar amino acid transport system ATP-binding protein